MKRTPLGIDPANLLEPQATAFPSILLKENTRCLFLIEIRNRLNQKLYTKENILQQMFLH